MRISLFSSFLSVIVLLVSCSYSKEENSRFIDGLYVEKAYYDFGEVNKKHLQHIPFLFKLENKNGKTITINKIDVSCDCVKLKKIPNSIKPGKTGHIEGFIETNGQSGKLSKILFVNFNEKQVILLRVTGIIE